MAVKRCFEDDLNLSGYENRSKNVNKKFFKDKDHDELKNCLNTYKEKNEQITHSNDVNLIVKNLLSELVKATENESIKNDESMNNKLFKTFSTTTSNQLDDSFKLNYDFDSNKDSLDEGNLFNNQFENSFSDTLTSVEHNYANVPTTSTTINFSNHPNISKPVKGALKNVISTANKKNVKFKGVEVFYFSRNQGGSTVPSQGGSTLGMEMNHCDLKSFTLDAHQEEKRQVHREILLRQKRFEKMYQKQQARISNSNQSDSEDSLDNISDISDSELEFDSWYFLQPVPVKQRRALLRESGINKIDSGEKEECKGIRMSREFCGCECGSICDPETCLCSLNGIKCQVDRLSFPCGCLRDSCGNLNGRTEFNPLRVRTHFIHTIMRIELEKKNENQQFNDETLNSSSSHHYLKPNSNIEFMNQNNSLFTPLNSNTNQQQMYNETSNILNCNEANLTSNEYDLYDSSDSGSSSENSDCTSDELDCTLRNAETDNQTLNGLNFNSLSPFSLLSTSSVPVTSVNNNDLINSNYDENNYNNFLASDQSFNIRYYSSTLNNNTLQQTDQNSLVINTTTAINDQPQLINNHHLNYQSYYSQQNSMYTNNLSHLDHCYSVSNTQQNDASKLTMTYNSNDLQLESQSYQQEMHHYTDLSQSIASSNCSVLINQSPSSAIVDNEFVNCSPSQLINDSTVVNNDDSSSSRQSLNSNLDNYLTSAESTQNELGEDEEDSFGEIIKNTIVESVIA